MQMAIQQKTKINKVVEGRTCVNTARNNCRKIEQEGHQFVDG